jgi:hypothetical protein
MPLRCYGGVESLSNNDGRWSQAPTPPRPAAKPLGAARREQSGQQQGGGEGECRDARHGFSPGEGEQATTASRPLRGSPVNAGGRFRTSRPRGTSAIPQQSFRPLKLGVTSVWNWRQGGR